MKKTASKKPSTNKTSNRKTPTKKTSTKKSAAPAKRPSTANKRPAQAKKTAVRRVGARADLGAPVDGFFAKQPAHLRSILDVLRKMVEAAAPDAESSLKWGMPFYSVNGAMMCALGGHKAHVNLILSGPPGTYADPDGLLSGDGKTGRHLKLTSLDDLPRDAVKRWLSAAAEHARKLTVLSRTAARNPSLVEKSFLRTRPSWPRRRDAASARNAHDATTSRARPFAGDAELALCPLRYGLREGLDIRWLDEMAIESRVDHRLTMIAGAVSRQRDEVRRPSFAQRASLARDLEAVGEREADVDHRDVEGLLVKEFDGALSVMRGRHAMTSLLEHDVEEL